MSASTPLLVVLTTLPDLTSARQLAASLLAQQLVACAQIGSPITSLYVWQGQAEESAEIPLLLKTTEAAYPALEAAIRQQHPYDTPEIIASPVSHAFTGYADWVRAAVIPAG